MNDRERQRTAILRVLTDTERHLADTADPRCRRRLEADLRMLHWALEWQEEYHNGPHAFVWRGRRMLSSFGFGFGIPLVWLYVSGYMPLALVPLSFGAAISLGYLFWRSAARTYRAFVAQGDQLLLKEPQPTP